MMQCVCGAVLVGSLETGAYTCFSHGHTFRSDGVAPRRGQYLQRVQYAVVDTWLLLRANVTRRLRVVIVPASSTRSVAVCR